MHNDQTQDRTEQWLRRRWSELVRAVGLGNGADEAGADLLRRYHESHRRYHNTEHIRECLALLDTVRDLARDPWAVEAAIWFHDAVYEGAEDDEARSARLAREVLTCLGAQAPWVETVSALVLATEHTVVPEDGDAMLLCDIDLYRLAAAPSQFDANTNALREEGGPDRRKTDLRHKAFFQTMLARESIYRTEHFRRQYESAARANMERALAAAG